MTHLNEESPISAVSIPLPRSTTASPAVAATRSGDSSGSVDAERDTLRDAGIRSMDITEIHVSPPKLDLDPDSEFERDQSQTDGVLSADSQSGEEHAGSQDQNEATFSSDGEPTPYSNRRNGQPAQPSPGALSIALSSPAPSLAFTPTPAFPRPRARFSTSPPNELAGTPNPPETLPEREHEPLEDENHEVPLTPHTRRRSFLLSVINSTARPRLKFPTPHPRNNFNPATPSIAESTPPSGASSVIRTNLQTAFAGVTPRPRGATRGPRASHPLAQTVFPSPATSDSESTSPSPGGQDPVNPWATPAPGYPSPYDGTGAGDRASFISTASSHDLTAHHRVNTSFDPAMGFGAGAPGHGVGRFNAGKLNNYLHGLNRRLQEENEALMERLTMLEEKEKKLVPTVASPSAAAGESSNTARRLSGGGGRRTSAGGSVLRDVEEDVGGEGWMEEKAELEDMVDALKEELTKCIQEREYMEKALGDEREERAKDKERWKDRMVEVEQGVEVIIKELEEKAEVAERRTKKIEEDGSQLAGRLEKRLSEVEEELEVAVERAEKAERVLESGKELGGELREANERVAKIMGDLRNANAQIKELEEEVMRSDSRIDDLEKDLQDDRNLIAGLEEKLNSKGDELAAERSRMQEVEKMVEETDEELRATKAYVDELEEGASIAIERIETLEDELATANDKIQTMTSAGEQQRDRIEKLEEDVQMTEELTRQLEEALEEAERKMLADEEALNDLKSKITAIERERQREANITQDSSRNPFHDVGPTEADVEALENELDNANKEIARLTTLLDQSPARKAMEKARDVKVEMLEREKEELLERNKALRLTLNEMNIPNKLMNTSGISPIHRQVLSMSLRAPRTPGTPLRDVSRLSNHEPPDLIDHIA
jgi:chromosome segregation ATPase